MSEVKVTQADIYAAAIQYCGEKDRETSNDDIRYFEANWESLPGLRSRVEAFARHRQSAQVETLAVLEQAREAIEAMIPMPGNDRQMHGTYAQGVFDALTTLTAKIEEIRNGQS